MSRIPSTRWPASRRQRTEQGQTSATNPSRPRWPVAGSHNCAWAAWFCVPDPRIRTTVSVGATRQRCLPRGPPAPGRARVEQLRARTEERHGAVLASCPAVGAGHGSSFGHDVSATRDDVRGARARGALSAVQNDGEAASSTRAAQPPLCTGSSSRTASPPNPPRHRVGVWPELSTVGAPSVAGAWVPLLPASAP
jgi:hypothetical protein